jgi:hypothetical protein
VTVTSGRPDSVLRSHSCSRQLIFELFTGPSHVCPFRKPVCEVERVGPLALEIKTIGYLTRFRHSSPNSKHVEYLLPTGDPVFTRALLASFGPRCPPPWKSSNTSYALSQQRKSGGHFRLTNPKTDAGCARRVMDHTCNRSL